MKSNFLKDIFFENPDLNLSIQSRSYAKNYVISNNIDATSLLNVIHNLPIKQKIVWYHVLDRIVEENYTYLNTNLEKFLQNSLSENNESIKRCVSRIIYQQLKSNSKVYNLNQKEQIIQTMFDWILVPSLVATRVNAIHVLYFLVDQETWIKEQLIAIIQQNMLLKEASFLSRGKKILRLLHKSKS